MNFKHVNYNNYSHQSCIQYEHPLNEKIRVFLRAEYLWQELEYNLQMENNHNCVNALKNILQLLEINERIDLKSEAIKYIDKLIVKFNKILESPEVDVQRTKQIVDDLQVSLNRIRAIVGKLSASLYNNEWLATIRQKILLPGGTCQSDLPFLYYWQQFPLNQKVKQIVEWQQVFYPLIDVVNRVLFFIRQTSCHDEITCYDGTYQKIIETQFEPQLLTIEVPAKLKIYPEISGNRYRVAVRFLQTDLVSRATVYNDRVDFKLGICW